MYLLISLKKWKSEQVIRFKSATSDFLHVMAIARPPTPPPHPPCLLWTSELHVAAKPQHCVAFCFKKKRHAVLVSCRKMSFSPKTLACSKTTNQRII